MEVSICFLKARRDQEKFKRMLQNRLTIVESALRLLERGELVTRVALAKESGWDAEFIHSCIRKDEWLICNIKLRSSRITPIRRKYLRAKRALQFKKLPVNIKTLARQMGYSLVSVHHFLYQYPEIAVELGLTRLPHIGYSTTSRPRHLAL